MNPSKTACASSGLKHAKTILSVIFEKLLKNRISDTLQQNISKFQNGGMKGKGVVDNLFILRGIINHANYLGKELWLTFYDIEKCFDSLWLEDCINSFVGSKCQR